VREKKETGETGHEKWERKRLRSHDILACAGLAWFGGRQVTANFSLTIIGDGLC
jgi:hypothetical protein